MPKKVGKKPKESPSGRISGSRPSTPPIELPSTGYLVACDIPTKNFIQHLNDVRPREKRFIIKELDQTHLLVKHKARDEILIEVEKWQNSNVFSAVEQVGENLDMS
uniref:General transcription and DNA repair factor IIH subunit TFB5 n=1 Tax=Amphora coffeiformis TaxID=265554 RepID=A0A7S3L5P3_9STRA|mmetsp:Transcript_12004/g.23051  ORF Transcript_12004/g.23051 Transcript_12004/m.23051 type:complete len:106 (+) Transcript_12004:95-412(+)